MASEIYSLPHNAAVSQTRIASTIDGRDQLLEPHATLEDAERFARDVTSNNFNCTASRVIALYIAAKKLDARNL